MINYYMTRKGKMYLCHNCGITVPSVIVMRIMGMDVQWCGECWKPEYRHLNENVNENEALPGEQNIL